LPVTRPERIFKINERIGDYASTDQKPVSEEETLRNGQNPILDLPLAAHFIGGDH
jgi:hypothetical protein